MLEFYESHLYVNYPCQIGPTLLTFSQCVQRRGRRTNGLIVSHSIWRSCSLEDVTDLEKSFAISPNRLQIPLSLGLETVSRPFLCWSGIFINLSDMKNQSACSFLKCHYLCVLEFRSFGEYLVPSNKLISSVSYTHIYICFNHFPLARRVNPKFVIIS